MIRRDLRIYRITGSWPAVSRRRIRCYVEDVVGCIVVGALLAALVLLAI